jgi:hypothetical protein
MRREKRFLENEERRGEQGAAAGLLSASGK